MTERPCSALKELLMTNLLSRKVMETVVIQEKCGQGTVPLIAKATPGVLFSQPIFRVVWP